MSGHRARPARIIGAGLIVALGLAGCGTTVAESSESSRVAAPTTSAATATAPSVPTARVDPTATSTTAAASTTTAASATTATASTATTAASTVTTAGPPPVRSGANVNQSIDVGDPLRVVVESVGIDGPIEPAGLLGDGTIAVPDNPKVAGWFTGGPRPGDLGPAVIVGHVDSRAVGLGVFWHLDKVAVGATVTVETTDAEQHFVVVAVQQIPKVDFPTADVYGLVPSAALRLITCGGTFDRSIGHYRDNVVVYLEKINV